MWTMATAATCAIDDVVEHDEDGTDDNGEIENADNVDNAYPVDASENDRNVDTHVNDDDASAAVSVVEVCDIQCSSSASEIRAKSCDIPLESL